MTDCSSIPSCMINESPAHRHAASKQSPHAGAYRFIGCIHLPRHALAGDMQELHRHTDGFYTRSGMCRRIGSTKNGVFDAGYPRLKTRLCHLNWIL